MKLTMLFLFCALIQVSASVYSQQTKLSLSLKNVSVKEVLRQIENQSDFFFLYKNENVDVNRVVTVDIKDKSVESLLDQIFNGTSVSYEVINRQIVLVDRGSGDVFFSTQQQKSVSGKVTDSGGAPLPGVSVVIKGTTGGTITDANGTFRLNVSNTAKALVFSFVGMKQVEVLIAEKTTINVTLQEESIGLEEVVAVGYGTQKKTNLTGAVQQVKAKDLVNRPVISIGQGLQGLIPNLNVAISSGRANAAPDLNIRGMVSLSGGQPLIIVDGVPSSMTEFMTLNTNDIESVSSLMDAASAAIYGARAAFGVILITTKSAGKEDIQVTYNSNVALRQPTVVPEFILDQNTVMRARVAGTGGWYTLKDIYGISDWDLLDKVTNGEEPEIMLNPEDPTRWLTAGRTNWYKEAMKPFGVTQNHNATVSGTSDKTRYYFSGGYSEQEGVFRYGNDIFDKYNFRGKVDFDITKWLVLSNNTSYSYDYYNEPSQGFSFGGLMNTPSLDVIKNPDGSWSSSGASIFGSTMEGGRSYTRTSHFWSSFSAKADFFHKILVVTAKGTFLRANQGKQSHSIPVQYKSGPEKVEYLHPVLDARRENYGTRQNVFDLYADFTKSFNRHNVHVLAGFNQEYYYSDWYSAYRKDLISASVPSINLATGDKEVGESITDWATRSGFFRVNYDFAGKYLFEVNGRYDGTSRFPTNDRFGFFPSMSLGWNILKENFFAGYSNTVTTLKPRLSYGVLGNQDVGAYAYLASMSAGKTSSILAGNKTEQQTTLYAPGIVANSLTWETVKTTNYGVDFGFIKNRMTGSLDYYHRAVLNMLTKSKKLPGVLGTSEPKENAADLITKGWELALNWNDSFILNGSQFRYSFGTTLADSRAWITKFDNPEGRLSDYYVGYEVGTIWGYVVNGLFQTPEELKNHANQSQFWTYPGKVTPGVGDMKFEDLNGDGMIRGANTIYDMQDQKKIGNSRPRYHFGLKTSADWKGFDFSMFVQGVLKQDWYPTSQNFWGLNASPWTNLQKYQHENSWTPENPDAYLPRLKGYAASWWSGAEMLRENTRYLQNNAYVRLKNISLGYSLPAGLISKMKLQQIRVYFSGENLLTWTGIKNPNIDPEAASNDYPLQKMYSFGVNVKF